MQKLYCWWLNAIRAGERVRLFITFNAKYRWTCKRYLIMQLPDGSCSLFEKWCWASWSTVTLALHLQAEGLMISFDLFHLELRAHWINSIIVLQKWFVNKVNESQQLFKCMCIPMECSLYALNTHDGSDKWMRAGLSTMLIWRKTIND